MSTPQDIAAAKARLDGGDADLQGRGRSGVEVAKAIPCFQSERIIRQTGISDLSKEVGKQSSELRMAGIAIKMHYIT